MTEIRTPSEAAGSSAYQEPPRLSGTYCKAGHFEVGCGSVRVFAGSRSVSRRLVFVISQKLPLPVLERAGVRAKTPNQFSMVLLDRLPIARVAKCAYWLSRAGESSKPPARPLPEHRVPVCGAGGRLPALARSRGASFRIGLLGNSFSVETTHLPRTPNSAVQLPLSGGLSRLLEDRFAREYRHGVPEPPTSDDPPRIDEEESPSRCRHLEVFQPGVSQDDLQVGEVAQKQVGPLQRVRKGLLGERGVGADPEDLDVQLLELVEVDLPRRQVPRSDRQVLGR